MMSQAYHETSSMMVLGKWGWLVVVVLLIGSGPASALIDVQLRARAVVTDFMEQKFDKVEAQFDPALRDELPEIQMYGVWLTLRHQFGDFKSIVSTRQETLPNYRVVVVNCRFEQVTWEIRVAFDSRGRIGGLFFVPPKTQVADAGPAGLYLSMARSDA